MRELERLLEYLLALVSLFPIATVYLLIAAGTAVENVFPPVPSDTVVLVSGVLVDRGLLQPLAVLGAAWAGNVGGALLVYAAARRYGRGIFRTRWGHWLLRPHQLEHLAEFYGRWGLPAIFASRFLPVFRVLVPAFAGISRLGVWSTALPLAVASALWYAVLMGVGIVASRNVRRIVPVVEAANVWLVGLAALAAAGVAVWWYRSRR